MFPIPIILIIQCPSSPILAFCLERMQPDQLIRIFITHQAFVNGFIENKKHTLAVLA